MLIVGTLLSPFGVGACGISSPIEGTLPAEFGDGTDANGSGFVGLIFLGAGVSKEDWVTAGSARPSLGEGNLLVSDCVANVGSLPP